MNTYSKIEVYGRCWLVPEPLMEEPNIHSVPSYQEARIKHTKWITEKSGWIEIKGEINGWTGLIEGKDFSKQTQFFLGGKWYDTTLYKDIFLRVTRVFAIPIQNNYLTDLEGLTEGVDFKYIREVLTPDNKWIKAVKREWWDILPEDRKRLVAVPIENGEDELWEEAMRIIQTEWRPINNLKKSFTIKRRQ